MSKTERPHPLLSRRTRGKLEKLLAAVTNEDRPVRIVAAPFNSPDVCCNAFTPAGPAPSWLHAKVTKEYGGWEDGSQVIVICQKLPRYKLRGTLLHERAHDEIAERPVTHLPTELQRMQAALAEVNLKYATVGDNTAMPAWFIHHGAPFIRLAMHLHFRAWRAGYDIGLPEMNVAGELYDLSPAWAYRHALGDEPRRMLGRTLAEIAAEPFPADFKSLFRADFAEWSKRREAERRKPTETNHVQCA